MSSNDHPNTHGTAGEPNQSHGTTGGVPHILLFFIIGLSLSLIVGWGIFPKLLYSQKSQPFDFSHKLHLKQVKQSCQSCHFFREDGTFSGSPRLAQCLECHEEIQGQSEDEAIFVEQYASKGREVPWQVYARQPDCVFCAVRCHPRFQRADRA
ncbi:MAG: cytochrome c3 family protein [Desulfatitalea sp.]|nr:cytochrome c3 family protein [Desulfatitalea sp.]